MKEFYEKMVSVFMEEQTKDIYRSQGVLPVRFVDLYAGQDYDPQNFDAHLFPALFVHWSVDHTSQTATMTIRLAYEQLRDYSSVSSNAKEALKFLDFVRITNKILVSFHTKNTGRLVLMGEELAVDETVVDVYILTYSCRYQGMATPKEYLKGVIENVHLETDLYQKLLD
ncbi:hypothetical protein BWK60_01510 [Flavobacterium covae]|nr:hypothetical protein [Flavobacterium covae]OWP87858.1 hypothetical protein BWK60_01510 [Flavobacterium covae]POR25386.1 hypothetical protein BWK58_06560 [Flavobacterium columnare]